MQSKSESRRKFSIKYSDERDKLVAYADSCEGKVWIAKSSSGAKGELPGLQCYYKNMYIPSAVFIAQRLVGLSEQLKQIIQIIASFKNPN